MNSTKPTLPVVRQSFGNVSSLEKANSSFTSARCGQRGSGASPRATATALPFALSLASVAVKRSCCAVQRLGPGGGAGIVLVEVDVDVLVLVVVVAPLGMLAGSAGSLPASSSSVSKKASPS